MYEIYKLRVSVFVVEQNCPYQKVDDADKVAFHLYLKDEEGIKAYARVLPPGTVFDEVSLGRVIAPKRKIQTECRFHQNRSPSICPQSL